MRIVEVGELTSGMELAREIVNPDNGRILLGIGAVNLPQHAGRLKGMGINYVYVTDPLSSGIDIPRAVSEEIRASVEAALDKVYEKYEMDHQPDFWAVKQTAQALIREVLSKPEILVDVYEMRQKGGGFLGHSVNVAFLALMLGSQMGLDEDKMKKLGVGALLHDVGVAGMPQSLLESREELTLEGKLLYEQHPVIGYHRVKESWEISPLSRGIILSHHERADGTGYPRRMMKGDIHEFSRIVGLVDFFEELAGGHPFSRRLDIQNAVEILNAKAEDWFDRELVRVFVCRIPLCPTGTTVKLNDGRSAVVVAQNKGFPTRPVVRIFEDAAGRRIDPQLELDLLKNNHLLVQACGPKS